MNFSVVATKTPMDALSALRTMPIGSVDLVLSDVHMPQMSGMQLQAQVAKEFDLPIVLMSGDNNEDLMIKGLEGGAELYFIKPIALGDLKNLWQLVVRRRKCKGAIAAVPPAAASNLRRTQSSSQDVDADPSIQRPRTELKERRRKHSRRSGSSGIGADGAAAGYGSTRPKKQKMVWTAALHAQFCEAVEIIGLEKAVPKKILEYMNVPGLTRENIASHLQKYRLFLKRVFGGMSGSGVQSLRRAWNEKPFISNFALSHLPLLAGNFEEGSSGNLAQQAMTSTTMIPPHNSAINAGASSNFTPQTVGRVELPSLSMNQPKLYHLPTPGGSTPPLIPQISSSHRMNGTDAVPSHHLLSHQDFSTQFFHPPAAVRVSHGDRHPFGSDQPKLVVESSGCSRHGICVMADDINADQYYYGSDYNFNNDPVQRQSPSCLSPELSDLVKELESDDIGNENIDTIKFDDASFRQLAGDDRNSARNNVFGQANVGYTNQVFSNHGFPVELFNLHVSTPENLNTLNQGQSGEAQIFEPDGHHEGYSTEASIKSLYNSNLL
ncbi:hypothetical protein Nepgr_031401 [Nepenthes gracilis]|uniref:Two-component response regulator n=1 Tax=Nepenthes gracilis TaxID=150966 RepID=A0AAD3TID0_NEPGR|nr:hypothetical protein Nepgr_031401 [Nepenthes gracilis]